MKKYDIDLDYVIRDVDITEDELVEIIREANTIIKNNKDNAEALACAYLKRAQCIQISSCMRMERSKRSLEKALKLCPDMPEALLTAGKLYSYEDPIGKNNYKDEALAYFNKALEINPDYAAAYYERADLYPYRDEKRLADYNEAIRGLNPIMQPHIGDALIFILIQIIRKALLRIIRKRYV
jgi:tetratricopeptide (TPR) repeat protein